MYVFTDNWFLINYYVYMVSHILISQMVSTTETRKTLGLPFVAVQMTMKSVQYCNFSRRLIYERTLLKRHCFNSSLNEVCLDLGVIY